MLNRNSSAGTVAKKWFKSSLLQRPAIILAMLLLCAVYCKAQLSLGGSLRRDCGTWVTDTSYSTWEPIDTLGKRRIADTIRLWVYDVKDEPLPSNNMISLVYCPCGCPFSNNYWQYRICRITGIRQKRLKENYHHLIPPPKPAKTEYEKVVDSLGVTNVRH